MVGTFKSKLKAMAITRPAEIISEYGPTFGQIKPDLEKDGSLPEGLAEFYKIYQEQFAEEQDIGGTR